MIPILLPISPFFALPFFSSPSLVPFLTPLCFAFLHPQAQFFPRMRWPREGPGGKGFAVFTPSKLACLYTNSPKARGEGHSSVLLVYIPLIVTSSTSPHTLLYLPSYPSLLPLIPLVPPPPHYLQEYDKWKVALEAFIDEGRTAHLLKVR